MFARIFQPAKTATQSGKARTGVWRLEFEAEAARRIDPLMGWTSGADTRAGQVAIDFETRDAAIGYCERQAIPYSVEESSGAAPIPKAYSDNFAFHRRLPWTH
jgi:hypothetical protein